MLKAAFDVGSGSTKMVVLDDVGGTVMSRVADVLLAHDMEAAGGEISDGIAEQLAGTLKEFAENARQCAEARGEQILLGGVATAVFRKARNAKAVLERASKASGVDIDIIDQKTEGRLGYETCKALHPSARLAWDSGGASFQLSHISEDNLMVYEGPWGASTATAALVRDVRGMTFERSSAVNPVSLDECVRLKRHLMDSMPDSPGWLADARAPLVGCFGGETSAFNVARLVLEADGDAPGTGSIAHDALWRALERQCVGHGDDELARRGFHLQVEMTVPKVVLVCAVLERVLGPDTDVRYSAANGSCEGVASYWLRNK